ncbi:Gfo/Idh/MocA family protein [Gemmatimonadota bacterium]
MSEKGSSRNADRKIDRRRFIGEAAAASAAFTIVPRHVLGGPGYRPPSDVLNIGIIGVGGRGSANRNGVRSENIVALCDVDDTKVAAGLEQSPNAKTYRDFRVMLEREPGLDAVMVSTPDHCHTVAAVTAMRLGKHVYVEKPLTHSISEARLMAETARRYGVATQMGNQGHSRETARQINEWILDGAIGDVREVHTWTNRPIWPQGIGRPEETPPVPSTLAWDLWLGPAPERPYHPRTYHPFNWRGWWDFGTGALGDMACHIIDFPFWALDLGHPVSVEASCAQKTRETYPVGSIVRFEFPARGSKPPVTLTWWDGGLMPPRPEELEPGRIMGTRDGGGLFIGDKGKLMFGCYSDGATLIPQTAMDSYTQPAPSIPRSVGHHAEWIEACKGGAPAASSFDFAGPLTEMILLGCLALRMDRKLEWDGENMVVTNEPEANRFVTREYRAGWEL